MGQGKGKGKGKGVVCWGFGKSGHPQRLCPLNPSPSKGEGKGYGGKSGGQGKGKPTIFWCNSYKCGANGHSAKFCPKGEGKGKRIGSVEDNWDPNWPLGEQQQPQQQPGAAGPQSSGLNLGGAMDPTLGSLERGSAGDDWQVVVNRARCRRDMRPARLVHAHSSCHAGCIHSLEREGSQGSIGVVEHPDMI